MQVSIYSRVELPVDHRDRHWNRLRSINFRVVQCCRGWKKKQDKITYCVIKMQQVIQRRSRFFVPHRNLKLSGKWFETGVCCVIEVNRHTSVQYVISLSLLLHFLCNCDALFLLHIPPLHCIRWCYFDVRPFAVP